MALTQHFFNPASSSFFHRSAFTSSIPFSLRTNTNTVFFSPRVQNLQNPAPTFSRRLFLPSVSAIWDALTGGSNNAREAVIAIRRGMLLFIQVNFVLVNVVIVIYMQSFDFDGVSVVFQGDVLGSLAEFDKAIEFDSRQKACMFVSSCFCVSMV